MSNQPRPERSRQNRVVILFNAVAHPDHLGYRYLEELGGPEHTRALNPP
jgi:hypothetical protein